MPAKIKLICVLFSASLIRRFLPGVAQNLMCGRIHAKLMRFTLDVLSLNL
jgi:hypothetical protein